MVNVSMQDLKLLTSIVESICNADGDDEVNNKAASLIDNIKSCLTTDNTNSSREPVETRQTPETCKNGMDVAVVLTMFLYRLSKSPVFNTKDVQTVDRLIAMVKKML